MSLDKRLEDIKACEFEEVSMYLDDEAIEAIKQAFIDEGWIRMPQVYMVEGSLRVNGEVAFTGPEWLARFEKELEAEYGVIRGNNSQVLHDLQQFKKHLRIARRAAGVDE